RDGRGADRVRQGRGCRRVGSGTGPEPQAEGVATLRREGPPAQPRRAFRLRRRGTEGLDHQAVRRPRRGSHVLDPYGRRQPPEPGSPDAVPDDVIPTDDLYPRDDDHRYRLYFRKGKTLELHAAAATMEGIGLAIKTLHEDCWQADLRLADLG